jgi:AraC family transcriptional regulator, transcriptional activator of pobA
MLMRLFKFSKNKYGVELLMDIGTYTDIPAYFFENTIHCTDFYEIVFFKKGNGYLELDQQRIAIDRNVIVFISPFQKRRWFVDKSKIECCFLFFQDTFLSKFFSDKLFTYRLQYFYNKVSPLFLKPDEDYFLLIFDVLRDLLGEIKNFRSDSEHITRALLYFLLIKLNRTYAESYQLSDEIKENTTAFKFKQLLANQVTQHSDIAYYAQRLAVSRVTLNKCVKAQFGITVSEMINEFILAEIKSLLLYTDLSVKEIAYELHFSAPNHLSRFFKTLTGLSPKDFRSAYQNGISVF